MTIGLVGCGAIGSRLAREIERRFKRQARLIGVYDSDPRKAERLSRCFRPRIPILQISELVSRSDLLIEAASPKAVRQLLPHVISKRKAMLVMSTGGILQSPELVRRARAASIPLYLPSGAIVGLDGIKAAANGALKSVTLTTRKPPLALKGSPELVRRRIRLDRVKAPQVLFEGSATEAIKAFPQNVNVAATLALAGLGPHRTRVRVVVDPSLKRNVHEIEVVGSFGRLLTRTENLPSRKNPRTSQLAVLSALATLRQIFSPLRIGT